MMIHSGSAPRARRFLPILLALFAIAALACTRNLSPTGGWAAPVVTDDAVFIADKNGDLRVFDVASGQFRNSAGAFFPGDDFDVGKIYGKPIIKDDVIFLSAYDCSGADCEANVIAIDRNVDNIPRSDSTGLLWRDLRPFTPPDQDSQDRNEFNRWFNIETEIVGDIALHGDTLIFGTSEIGDDDQPGGFLIALDTTPGSVSGDRIKWMFPVEKRIWGSPIIVGDTAYFTSMDSHVYAVDLSDGISEKIDTSHDRLLWSFETDGAAIAEPLIRDGKLYVGDFEGSFYALDLEARALDTTGRTLDLSREWKFDAKAWIWAKAVVDGDVVYAATLSGDVFALDRDSGQPIWPAPTEIEGQIVAQPAIYDDPSKRSGSRSGRLLAVPSGDDAVWVIDAATGQELGKFATNSGVKASPVVKDNLLYVHTLDRELQWFSLGDRSQLGCLKLQSGERCG
ncbi:MAG: PQQ-binding-like beta-propeller repeat protein [Chloroflexi bacterium]|nr:PQQ-binding-like beta-propeller repeat protein [Chloroflexota bacterium]